MTNSNSNSNNSEAQDLYELLSVDRWSSLETIKKAFRKKASKAHPDKGGNVEEFKLIRLAYEVLSSPDKREQYDRTGSYDNKPSNKASEVAALFAALFEEVIGNIVQDIKYVNIIKSMEALIASKEKELREQVATLTKETARLELLASKLSFKGSSSDSDVLGGMLASKIENAKLQIENANKQFDVFAQLRAMLPLYEYAFEEKPVNKWDVSSAAPEYRNRNSTETLAEVFDAFINHQGWR